MGNKVWGCFYNYHYGPQIPGLCRQFGCWMLLILLPFTDLQGVDDMSFNFGIRTPLKQYQQLMGVLPVASMDHGYDCVRIQKSDQTGD